MQNKHRLLFNLFLLAALVAIISCSSTVNMLLKVVPNSFDFGDIYITEKDTTDIMLLSKSKSPIPLTEIALIGRNASEFKILLPLTLPTTNNPTILQPNSTLKIQVEFEPQLPDTEKIAQIVVRWDIWNFVINLKGNAVAVPVFEMDPTSHDFELLSDGVTKTTEITFSNPGAKDMNITDFSFTGANASDFSVVNPTTPVTSANPLVVDKFNGTSTITVQILGTLPLGTKSAELVVTHDAEGSPDTFTLDAEVINEATLAIGPQQTAMFDPKLAGATDAEFTYILGHTGVQSDLTIEVKSGTSVVKQLFSGQKDGQAAPYTIAWDGKNAQDKIVDPGEYSIHLTATAGNQVSLDIPVSVVRLGIKTIAAIDNGGDNEFQMVYYLLNGSVRFTQTPATGEFNVSAENGQTSDLDNDDGTPRAMPTLHADIEEFPVHGGSAAQHNFNLPMCYIRGTTPKFEVTLGNNSTSVANGNSVPCGYPVAGYDIRMICKSGGATVLTSTDVNNQPGEKITFTAVDALPNNVSANSVTADWSWQYKASGSPYWIDIPGKLTTAHKIYTLYAAPYFPSSGTQYAPWVRVVDDVCRWGRTHVTGDLDTLDEMYVAIDHGFFLDAGSNGNGDYYYDRAGGGRTTYVSGSSVNLTGFYTHSRGHYLNCMDCATISCCLYNMMGCTNVTRVRLTGGMSPLYVIEGIGWGPSYTDRVFPAYGHSFGWHAVCSPDNNGNDILDDCMNVDTDGNPGSLPGRRGWNDPRPWSSYNALASPGNISKYMIGKHTAIQ